jgi:hypothetical protein
VSAPGRFTSTAGDHLELGTEFCNELAHDFGVARKLGGFGINRRLKRHGLQWLWVRRNLRRES